MPFDDLRGFLMVAEHGSFLSAAVAMGVSRSTLRRQVDALEARAGVPLFQRLRHGVVLTDAGRRLAQSGRSLEEQFSAVLRSVREAGQHPEGEVRCLMPVGLPPAFVAAIYRIFSTNWPRVRVHVDLHAAPLGADLAGVDVLVWFGHREPASGWTWHSLFDIPLRLFATPTYLEEHGTPATAADLDDHPVLAWLPDGEEHPHLLTRGGAPRAVSPVFVTSDVHLLHVCARFDLGIIWAPDGSLPQPPGSAPFVRVLESIYGGTTELRIAVPTVMVQVPKVRIFLDAVELIRQVAPPADT